MKGHTIRVVEPTARAWPTSTPAPHSGVARPVGVKIYGLAASHLQGLTTVCAAVGVSRPVVDGGTEAAADVWVWASRSDLGKVMSLFAQRGPGQAASVSSAVLDALRRSERPLVSTSRIGSAVFEWQARTYVMGIINMTPDSFSGDGLWRTVDTAKTVVETAVAQGKRMVDEGADLLDIGGESTRPGGTPVDVDTEMRRVLPVLSRLRSEVAVPISVDTYRASVAEAALDAGADMINDVWGLRMDAGMADLVARRRVPVVLMHNRSRPRDAEQETRLGGRYVGVVYSDLIADILSELQGQIARALSHGIDESQIIVDPGIGFGKTVEQNLRLVASAGEFRVLGYPILFGASRKSFIGYTLGLPPEERLEGTLAAEVAAVLQGGAHIVRAHDVRATVRAVRMADALVRGGEAL